MQSTRSRWATLSEAYLYKAILGRANLADAELASANLFGANLRNARSLIPEHLQSARNWSKAYRDEALACGKPIPEPVEQEAS